jgi:hypothetical protein
MDFIDGKKLNEPQRGARLGAVVSKRLDAVRIQTGDRDVRQGIPTP